MFLVLLKERTATQVLLARLVDAVDCSTLPKIQSVTYGKQSQASSKLVAPGAYVGKK